MIMIIGSFIHLIFKVELVEGSTAGTLARLTVAGSVTSKRSSLGRSLTPASLQQFSFSG